MNGRHSSVLVDIFGRVARSHSGNFVAKMRHLGLADDEALENCIRTLAAAATAAGHGGL